MGQSLGFSNRRFQGGSDRNVRADRGRSIRYRAGRIVRGDSPRKILSNEDVCLLNKQALHEAYGDGQQAPTHEIAEDAGQSKKAAENWWNGENPQGLTAFVNAYRNNPRFAAFARYYLLGHTENDPILEIQLHTAMANMDQAAGQLGMPKQQFAAAMAFAMSGNRIAFDAQALGTPNMQNFAGDEDENQDLDLATGDLFEGCL